MKPFTSLADAVRSLITETVSQDTDKYRDSFAVFQGEHNFVADDVLVLHAVTPERDGQGVVLSESRMLYSPVARMVEIEVYDGLRTAEPHRVIVQYGQRVIIPARTLHRVRARRADQSVIACREQYAGQHHQYLLNARTGHHGWNVKRLEYDHFKHPHPFDGRVWPCGKEFCLLTGSGWMEWVAANDKNAQSQIFRMTPGARFYIPRGVAYQGYFEGGSRLLTLSESPEEGAAYEFGLSSFDQAMIATEIEGSAKKD
jgi:hypothetical protein